MGMTDAAAGRRPLRNEATLVAEGRAPAEVADLRGSNRMGRARSLGAVRGASFLVSGVDE